MDDGYPEEESQLVDEGAKTDWSLGPCRNDVRYMCGRLTEGVGAPWAVDMTGFFAVIVLACALPYTQLERGHVGVDLLVLRMSPRSQAILDSITSAVSIGLFSVVAREMWLYARELSTKGEVSMTVQIPKAPFIYLISICFIFLCLVLLSDLIGNIRKAVHQ